MRPYGYLDHTRHRFPSDLSGRERSAARQFNRRLPGLLLNEAERDIEEWGPLDCGCSCCTMGPSGGYGTDGGSADYPVQGPGWRFVQATEMA